MLRAMRAKPMKSLDNHHEFAGEINAPAANQHNIARVIRQVRQNYAQPITVPVLARESGMSVRTLYRAYRSATGTTIAKDLARRRIEVAAQMLMEPGLKLEPIAIEAGFGNAKNLCRRFKEHFGLTPGQWRSAANQASKIQSAGV